jgi:transposase InsO family protein
LGVHLKELHESDTPFFGIVPTEGEYPLGHIYMPVTFGTPDNYRTEFLRFEVANFDCGYNAIIGRPGLTKFMAIPHYTYMILKMPKPAAGKQVGVHHPHKNIMTTDRPLELLHMDLFGPIAYLSIGGSKYCLVIVDDYSRFTWVFFLQEKSHTQEILKGFLRRAQNEFDLRIKKIRSDNGTEFKNSQIEGFLEEEGIKNKFSSPYTPQ